MLWRQNRRLPLPWLKGSQPAGQPEPPTLPDVPMFRAAGATLVRHLLDLDLPEAAALVRHLLRDGGWRPIVLGVVCSELLDVATKLDTASQKPSGAPSSPLKH